MPTSLNQQPVSAAGRLPTTGNQQPLSGTTGSNMQPPAQYLKPLIAGNANPVPIRLQDLQAAYASGSSLLAPQVGYQQHYLAQPRPKLAQGPPGQSQGYPPQGYQHLLGTQQLTQYHQRGLLQGQKSKAAMGQQPQQQLANDKVVGGGFRPPISLAPLPIRPQQVPRGPTSGPHISLAPLPAPTVHQTTSVAGPQTWPQSQSIPSQTQPVPVYKQGLEHNGLPQDASHPLDSSAHAAEAAEGAVLPPQSQPAFGRPPAPHEQAHSVQQEPGLCSEVVPDGVIASANHSGAVTEPTADPQADPAMPSLPAAQQEELAVKKHQVHFIPPGSAVIQPGPPMIHPGTTYNDSVSPSSRTLPRKYCSAQNVDARKEGLNVAPCFWLVLVPRRACFDVAWWYSSRDRIPRRASSGFPSLSCSQSSQW